MLLLKSISQDSSDNSCFLFFLNTTKRTSGPQSTLGTASIPLTLAFPANYGFKQSTSHCSLHSPSVERKNVRPWHLEVHIPGGGGSSLGESHQPPPSPHTHVHSHRLGHQVIFMIWLQYPLNLSHCSKIYRLTSSK